MRLQEFARALPPGSEPVKAKLVGYRKADGTECDYTVFIRPNIDYVYKKSIEALNDSFKAPAAINPDAIAKARLSMLRGYQSKLGSDHVVMSTNGPSVLFTALVSHRSHVSTSKKPKGEVAIAKRFLRDMCLIGRLKQFKLERCQQLIVNGIDILK